MQQLNLPTQGIICLIGTSPGRLDQNLAAPALDYHCLPMSLQSIGRSRTILTKLQDRELPDSQREQWRPKEQRRGSPRDDAQRCRYQAMADKIHLRIKAINLPGATRRR